MGQNSDLMVFSHSDFATEFFDIASFWYPGCCNKDSKPCSVLESVFYLDCTAGLELG